MITRRHIVLVLFGIVIFMAGTIVGHARQQRQRPDFVIEITAPSGTMTAECRSGCQFQITRPAGPGRSSDSISATDAENCPGLQNTACEYTLSGLISRRTVASN